MIEIFILDDHKWFSNNQKKKFLAQLQKSKFPSLENFTRPVMIMINRYHQSHDHDAWNSNFCFGALRLSWPWWIYHDHDMVTDLLWFWVVSTTLFAFNAPPTAIFFYEDIHTSHFSAGDVRGSWANKFRAIFKVFNL